MDLGKDALFAFQFARWEIQALTGNDPWDGIKGWFGQSDLDKIRRAEKEAAAARAQGHVAHGDALAEWIRTNQAVSLKMLTQAFAMGAYRPFIDRLRLWQPLDPSGTSWVHLEWAFDHFDSNLLPERAQAVEQFQAAGLTVIP